MKNVLFFLLLVFISGCVLYTTSCDYAYKENPGSETKEDDDDDNDDDIINNGVNFNINPPANTVKIMFIHHSTGSAWIASGNGNLGTALNNNNYYVTEADYGWDAEPNDDLGSSTDTYDWPGWFNDTKMPYVYANNANYDYTNVITNPGGENEIIMFKSCYPNSEVGSSIEGAGEEKELYNNLLDYFDDHTDKMFILVIPPPEIVINSTSLTRELSNWLVDRENGWLKDYQYNNVYAFNYYNILTDPKNHHRIKNSNYEENIVSGNPEDPANPDELYYYTGTNNHPTSAGHQKATDEFLPLLNARYNKWKGN